MADNERCAIGEAFARWHREYINEPSVKSERDALEFGWIAGRDWARQQAASDATDEVPQRCPHGHLYCCGHHDAEDMPIHKALTCPEG